MIQVIMVIFVGIPTCIVSLAVAIAWWDRHGRGMKQIVMNEKPQPQKLPRKTLTPEQKEVFKYTPADIPMIEEIIRRKLRSEDED